MDHDKSLLYAQDLTFSYSGDMGSPVFRAVNFSVIPGEIFCLLGPNGTGKSTLLKCVSNVLHGWTGTVMLDGRRVEEMSPAETARYVGYVPQNQLSTFPFLVKDVVVMGRNPHLNILSSPSKEDHAIASSAMDTVGVLPLADRPCTTLSGGEWQLVLIARALAQKPRIMILDEPTSHLDMGNQMRILDVVKDLSNKGLAIVMASHFPDHAFMVASEVAILNHSHITTKGTPHEVLTDESLKSTYGIDVKVLHIGDGVNRMSCFPALPGAKTTASQNGAGL